MTTELMTTQERMTSLQIAELTGKEHKNVMRDIRSLLDQGVGELNFELANYLDEQGKQRPCYSLTKKGCLILASGYNALLREKIINRWEELEKQAGQAKPLDFSDAQTVLQLAQNWAEEQKKREAAERRIAEQAPKVAFADAMLGNKTSCLVGELAKILTQNGIPNMGQNRFFVWLRENGYIIKEGEQRNMPKQRYIEQGLFEIKKGTRSDKDGVLHHTATTKVTPKGRLTSLRSSKPFNPKSYH